MLGPVWVYLCLVLKVVPPVEFVLEVSSLVGDHLELAYLEVHVVEHVRVVRVVCSCDSLLLYLQLLQLLRLQRQLRLPSLELEPDFLQRLHQPYELHVRLQETLYHQLLRQQQLQWVLLFQLQLTPLLLQLLPLHRLRLVPKN